LPISGQLVVLHMLRLHLTSLGHSKLYFLSLVLEFPYCFAGGRYISNTINLAVAFRHPKV